MAEILVAEWIFNSFEGAAEYRKKSLAEMIRRALMLLAENDFAKHKVRRHVIEIPDDLLQQILTMDEEFNTIPSEIVDAATAVLANEQGLVEFGYSSLLPGEEKGE